MIEQIRNRVKSIYKLDQVALDEFIDCLSIVNLPAKEYLAKEGRTAKKLYYIIKGAARSFYLKDGKEIVIWLALEDELITALGSFISQTKSKEYIELLEDSTLAEISYKDLKRLTNKHHSVSCFYNALIEEAFTDLDKQYREMHFFTAKEKYETLIKKHPKILQRFPLGYIASYLGITQESLSRIRSGKWK
jgi:CRP-like cAMP-binding protein